ncbi:unnamed protein product [Meloidogyne enterolobii]|uniref:Uncharacterized protein n=1 Tax=Meloidogyne enterolobii TaxID=390850 RepID=A0ACB0YUX7_MELEN
MRVIKIFNFRHKNFEIKIYEKLPRFITFESDTCPHALNFANTNEANMFKNILKLTIKRINNGGVKPQVQQPQNHLSPSTSNINQMPTGITNIGTSPQVGPSFHQFFTPNKKMPSKKDKNNDGRPTLTKKDLGAATDFA